MEAEEILKLFDSCWFERGIIFRPKHELPVPSTKFVDQRTTDENEEESTKVGVPNHQFRSLSDWNLGMNISNIFKEEAGKSASPRPVIMKPKLQKILSGKQIVDFSKQVSAQENAKGIKNRKKWRKGIMKRSLSALEFEEVKGFMDLGFVFDEDDKNSSLVSVIPGLQKMGKMGDDDDCYKEKSNNSQLLSRPYLSESWGSSSFFSERNNLMMNWTIPSVKNEINMKDHLRIWAQNVASNVR
ncbi:hypothetical protein ABFS83_08G206700 [Erythranthe nasuta]